MLCSKARGGFMAYLAILQFWDRREPLIVQHRRSDNKSSSCGHCSQWGIVAWESLSEVQMCWRAMPQEFALLTQGRDSTLFCQFGRFTAGASQHWKMWGSVYVSAFMFSIGSTPLLALGTVNVTRRKIYQGFRGRNEAKFYLRFPGPVLNPSSEIVVRRDPLNTHANFSLTPVFTLMKLLRFAPFLPLNLWARISYIPSSCLATTENHRATRNMLHLQFTATLRVCHFEIPIMSALAIQIADACTFLTCQIMKLGQVQYASYSVLIGTPLLHYWLVHSISKRLQLSQP